MKWPVNLLAGICVVLAVLMFAQKNQMDDLQRRYLADKQAANVAQEQQIGVAKTKCGAQAERVFASLGYSETKTSNTNPFGDGLTDHYNPQLKRCVMLIETNHFIDGRGDKSKTLMDADERKPLGEYLWLSSETKKYWEQKPITCHMTPPDKPEAFCQSTEEFDNYVKTLMD